MSLLNVNNFRNKERTVMLFMKRSNLNFYVRFPLIRKRFTQTIFNEYDTAILDIL